MTSCERSSPAKHRTLRGGVLGGGKSGEGLEYRGSWKRHQNYRGAGSSEAGEHRVQALAEDTCDTSTQNCTMLAVLSLSQDVHRLLGSFQVANSFHGQTPDEVSAVPVGTRWPKPYASLRTRIILPKTHFPEVQMPQSLLYPHHTLNHGIQPGWPTQGDSQCPSVSLFTAC